MTLRHPICILASMSVWFSSDWHLGHTFGANLRGFASVEEHDDHIIESAKSILGKNDKLYLLGDVAFSKRHLLRLREIPARITVIPGNHDPYSAWEWLSVVDDVTATIIYKRFILTHVLIHPQEMMRFRANIHGHIHYGGLTQKLPIEDRYYNVAVEWCNYLPVSYEYLDEIFPRPDSE